MVSKKTETFISDRTGQSDTGKIHDKRGTLIEIPDMALTIHCGTGKCLRSGDT
jgi:hypothetical protein